MTGPPLFTHPGWRRLTILALYGYQGLAAGFAVTALPNHLAGLGAAPEAIGAMLALIGLPWVLQPLWGPLIDRFGDARMGRRRAWIVLGLTGALACLAALPIAGDGAGALSRIGLLLLLHNACASLLDTAADAMIIDCVPADRLGETTALTRAGFVGGSALGAAAFSALAAAHGLPLAEHVLLLLGALAAAIPLLVREERGDALVSLGRRRQEGRGTASYLAVLKELAEFGRRRDILALLAVCVVEEFATAAFGVHFGLDLVATGRWDAASLSQLQGGLTLASGTVGALSIGLWLDRVGPRHALSLLLGSCVAAYVATALLLLGPRSYALEACAMALSSVVPALVFVSLAPTVMQIIRGSGAATQFALVMAALNGGGVLGSAVSGHLGALLPSWLVALGGAGLFALCTLAAAKPERLFGTTQPRSAGD
ncbi:MFS transporter [Belnapia sp. F-4-1]|uniref:MFS transporter n=1 Tax=Belnapia sp. F-4-1 TaxID=1545443 RepID=UPI00068C94D9|nr:MFS transporter [Belnapia sp. F-4-1]